MRIRYSMVLALGAAFLLAVPALAQPRQPGRGFGQGGGMLLLLNPSVQTELKLTDEQKEKLTKFNTEFREKMSDDFAKLRDRDLDRDERQKIQEKINEEMQKGTKDILTAEQSKRLEQITLQQRGLQAFSDAKVQEQLDLSEEQKTKIREINEEQARKQRELREGGFDPENLRRFNELRKESMEKAVGVLDAGQKDKWKEMTGEPFEVRFEMPRRPPAPPRF